MTARLYLEDPYRSDFDAQVLETTGGWCRLSRTAFYPGGGGQPADRGVLSLPARTLPVANVREDEQGRIWHEVPLEAPPGAVVHGVIDWPYRYALMRHHALMHVVNTIARTRFDGSITGVQLGPERSRIDFRLAGVTRDRLDELEGLVNAVIEQALPISASTITEAEHRARPELVRTLNVLPPVVDGRVRIVTIEGFDVQACGGTHVHSTREIGRARLVRFDNKGRDNKRLYWEAEAPAPVTPSAAS